MTRFFKNSFFIILVLVTLVGSGLQVKPAQAQSQGGMQVVPEIALPTGWTYGYLMGIWGSSPGDVYAVGYGHNGTDLRPLLYHKVGNSWPNTDLSLPVGWTSGYLYGVWGSGVNNVYAVGSGSANLPLLYRWNGSTWTTSVLPLPTGWSAGVLTSVWGSDENNVFVAGYGYGGGSFLPLIYYWNGSTWTAVSLSLPVGWSTGYLFGIWGSSVNDIYAVGTGSAFLPLLYHWNGFTWTASTPPLPAGWTSGSFRGIWGSAANNIYAVGSGNNGTTNVPLLHHWDGTNWTPDTSLILPTGITPGYLTGIWGSASSDIYIVGYGYQGTTIVPLLYHKDGIAWTESSPSRPTGWKSDFLYNVWGSGFSDVYAIGAGHNGTADIPLAYHSSQVGQDGAAPGNVTNLTGASGISTGSVDLSWTAPADDAGNDSSGAVASYLVRYSTSAISSETDWNNATIVSTNLPIPAAPNSSQTMTVSGLIPGTLYYFAVRAQDEQFNLSANFAATSATARLPATIGAGLYDDTDPVWNYTGNWTSTSQIGPYNNTDHYTNVQGASASLSFIGTKFTVYFTQYSNRGTMEVWIDGVQRYTINENGSLVWQQSWTLPDSLSNDMHTVEFKKSSADPAVYIDVDAIAITGPVGPGTYDNTHAAWNYTGNWTSTSQIGPYNNTDHYTNVQGASASLSFIGTKFTVYFTQYSNRGTMEVWIDGVQRYTINENGSLVWQQSWTLPDSLSNGTHTVEFKKSSADPAVYIDVDAIAITWPVGPGKYDNTHAAWNYTGNWTSASQIGPYNNTDHYTNVQGASASLSFIGTKFTVYFTQYFNRGNVEVWIDGVQRYTFYENGSLVWQQSWTLPAPLSNGLHAVEFKNPNASTSTYIDIDAVKIE